MKMLKDTFEKRIDELIKRITYVNTNINIYKRLTELCADGNKYSCVLKSSKIFWSMFLHNLESSIISELCRIYDKDSYSIKKVINVCEQNQSYLYQWNECREGANNTIKNTISTFKQKYESIERERIKLLEIRDRCIAHNDKKFLIDNNLYDDFTWGDIEDLANTASYILTNIYLMLTGKQQIPLFIEYEDIDTIIKSVYNTLN